MTPPPLNASLGAMSAAVSGGATKSGGGLGSPTGVVTTNAGLTTARGGHGHDYHHHHHHHHHNNNNQHQHQHRQHHHASVSGGVVSAAYQGSLSSRGAAGHGGVAPGGHHLHGPAPTPTRFFLAHHSIIVPKAAFWGHAALRDASTRGAIGVTSVSVSASASSSRAAAAAAAASATSQSIHRRHPLRRPQHPPRAAVVAAGTTSSSPSAPTSSFDDDDERGRRRGAKDIGGEHDEGEVQENKAAGARGDSAAAAAAAAADDFDSDKDDCEAPHYENCPVSPAFNDARIPSWMSVTRAKWDGVTARLASSATVPFLFLTVPQIAKNASLIAAGRPEALAAISWQGHVAGLLGNLLLLSYFADKGETSASVVQAAGVCATGALLFQMCLAGHIPVAAFAAAAVAVAAGVMLSGMRIARNRAGAAAAADDDVAAAASSRSGEKRALDVDGVPCVGNVQCDVGWDDDDDDDDDDDENEGGGASERRRRASRGRRDDDRAWEAYQGLLGVVGLAALPQVGLASLLPPQVTASLGVVPGVAGAALGLALVVMGRAGALPPALASAWGKLSGWTATLLFMTMPVAQLASNFARPASLEGLSILSSVLAMTGNALMVPRALYTRDVIWLTGSTWGSLLMGWGVMLSLFLGRRAADGARYVGSPAFFGLSVFFFGYLLAVLVVDGVASLAAGRHAGWRLAAWRFQGLSADDRNKKKKK